MTINVSNKSCKRIWDKYIDTVGANDIGGNMDSSNQNYGLKKKRTSEAFQNMVNVLLNNCSKIRSLSDAVGTPEKTLHQHLKSGDTKQHSSAARKIFNAKNIMERVQLCISHIITNGLLKDMYDHVHIY